VTWASYDTRVAGTGVSPLAGIPERSPLAVNIGMTPAGGTHAARERAECLCALSRDKPHVRPSEIKLVNRTERSVHDANGGVNVSASLVVLARNGWLEIERSGGEIRTRLGRRAKELRSPEERKGG
jgi:hypothetical protein